MCVIVEDYFADLLKTVRCTTVESVHSAITVLQVVDKALILDSAVPEFRIATLRAKVAAKIKAYMDKNIRAFRQLLNDCRFLEAYTLQTVFEELVAQYPEMSEFENVIFQGLLIPTFNIICFD